MAICPVNTILLLNKATYKSYYDESSRFWRYLTCTEVLLVRINEKILICLLQYYVIKHNAVKFYSFCK